MWALSGGGEPAPVAILEELPHSTRVQEDGELTNSWLAREEIQKKAKYCDM